MTAAGHRHVAGSVADEAGQLLDVVTDRLTTLRAATATQAGTDTTGNATTGVPAGERPHPDAACLAWCPVCRSAELLRGERPELAEKLIDTALLVVGALRSLIPPAATPTAEPAARVERIDIR